MTVWTDFPDRLTPGTVVYAGKKHQPVCIRTVRWHGKDLLVSFEEFPVREDVALLRNQVLMVRVEDLPAMEDGGLYIHELLGMTVVDDDDNSPLGEIIEIIETGANDVLVVRDKRGAELLLPDIDEVILAVDRDKMEVRVHLLPGLIP